MAVFLLFGFESNDCIGIVCAVILTLLALSVLATVAWMQNDHTFMKNSFNIVREYLYWCFRKTFLMVVVTESVIFLCWCWGFAILYYILGRLNPQCIQSHNGYNFEEADMGLVDAFTLSWTTFSTVVRTYIIS